MPETADGQLPDLLLIGAMKSATSSLAADLAAHPQVLMTADKEPAALSREPWDPDIARRAYAEQFSLVRRGRPAEILRRLDASTAYTRRPGINTDAVAQRARSLLPDSTRLLYLIRDPVERAVSHYNHMASMGGTSGKGIDADLRTHRPYIDFGRYAYQLEPWLERFDRDSLLIIPLDDYRDDREATLARIHDFMAVDRAPAPESRRRNASAGRPGQSGITARVRRHPLYRRHVRPWLSGDLRERLARGVQPTLDAVERPTDETVEWLRAQFVEDSRQLAALVGPNSLPWLST